MEIKNLFDPTVKAEIISRINRLTPATQRKWGKMDVAQMLAHTQKPLGVAIGAHELKGNILLQLFGRFFKDQLYNEKPYRQNLPTDKSFKIADQRDFTREKQTLIEMINNFSEDTLSGAPHPFFGKLTKEQWSKGSWKHLDHHLRQFGV